MAAETLSLPVSAWPESDRLAWESALMRSVDLFDQQSCVSTWAVSTQRKTAWSIGRFIAWSATDSAISDTVSIMATVTPEQLNAFIATERERSKFSTIRNTVWHLVAALEVFAPDADREGCWQIYRRLKRRASREVCEPRTIVHAARLYRCGTDAMDAATRNVELPDSQLYRNGLAVGLLAAAPIRIHNFSTLRLNHHLSREGQGWIISLAARETKTQTSDFWQLGAEISAYLDNYITAMRPLLLQRSKHSVDDGLLWIGDSGHSVGDQLVRRWVHQLTRASLGVQISPHSFRHCAATTYSIECPSRSVEASALLGHRSAGTTEKHYIIQQRQIVQADYLRILEARRWKGSSKVSSLLSNTGTESADE